MVKEKYLFEKSIFIWKSKKRNTFPKAEVHGISDVLEDDVDRFFVNLMLHLRWRRFNVLLFCFKRRFKIDCATSRSLARADFLPVARFVYQYLHRSMRFICVISVEWQGRLCSNNHLFFQRMRTTWYKEEPPKWSAGIHNI